LTDSFRVRPHCGADGLRRALTRLSPVALVLVAGLVPAHAEILLPSQSTTWDGDLWLTGATGLSGKPLALSVRLDAVGDTNVVPVLEADDDPLPPRLHRGDTSRFLSRSVVVRQLDYREWRLTRGWGTVQYLHGTSGAGQLWLDLKSGAARPGSRYQVALTGHETKLSWWGLSREFSFADDRVGDVTGRLGLRLLEAPRHREAALSGWYQDDEFSGALSLLSTRGSGFDSTGHGYAVDLDLRTDLSPRCSVGMRSEGLLGRLRWDRVRLLDASISSTNVFQDPEGFVHNLPSATGTERRFSHADSLTTLWEAGASWEEGKGRWVATVQKQGSPTTYHLTRVQHLGGSQCLLGTWTVNRNTFGLTYHSRHVSLSVSSSHVSLSDAFAGHVGLELRIP